MMPPEGGRHNGEPPHVSASPSPYCMLLANGEIGIAGGCFDKVLPGMEGWVNFITWHRCLYNST